MKKTHILIVKLLLLLFIISCDGLSSDNNNDIYYINNLNKNWTIRQPAEFEPSEGVILTFWNQNYDQGSPPEWDFGVPYTMIKELAKDDKVYIIINNSSYELVLLDDFQINDISTDNVEFILSDFDSWWSRDYAPWFIYDNSDNFKAIDFRYNRILSAGRFKDDAVPSIFAQSQNIEIILMPMIHTGGNFMSDGQGTTMSTDLIYSDNTGNSYYNYSEDQVNEVLINTIGVKRVFAFEDILETGIKHIDCWAKLLSVEKILIVEYPDNNNFTYQNLRLNEAISYLEKTKTAYGTSYKIFRILAPNNEPYTNSYIINNKVFVPTPGWDPQADQNAVEVYKEAMPGYQIIPILHNPTNPWKKNDAIHCRTREVIDREMLYIELVSVIDRDNMIEFNARIISYSNTDITSAKLHYRFENGEWKSQTLTSLDNDYYQILINNPVSNANLDFYIQAEDLSGRTQNNPFIGAYDPISITTK